MDSKIPPDDHEPKGLTWFDLDPPFCQYQHARAVIVPAPYEGTASWGQGAANGPAAIFAASQYIELYNCVLGFEAHKIGIHGLRPLALPDDPRQATLAVKAAVARQLESARAPVMVGGEHSLTLGAVDACLDRYPDLSVLALDAHADLRDQYSGTRHSHACVMRRIDDLGVNSVSAGVRSMSINERQWLDERGRDLIFARDVIENPDWIERALSLLSDRVYLTVDLDVIDPSQMPAVGCPEPGGISYYHLIDLILALARSNKQVVACDLMELAPIPGLNHPDYLAASLLYVMIGAFWGSGI